MRSRTIIRNPVIPLVQPKTNRAVNTAIQMGLLSVSFFTLAVESAQGQRLRFAFGGGPKILAINTAIAGGQPDDVIDSASRLRWRGKGCPCKMTVVTSAPGQSFSLFLTLDVTSGSAVSQGELELLDGMLDSDVLTQISRNESGAANITYRARATVSQGSSMEKGDDVHTVTYTILAQ